MRLSDMIEKLNRIKQVRGDIDISYIYEYHYNKYGKYIFGYNDQTKIMVLNDFEVHASAQCYLDERQNNVCFGLKMIHGIEDD